MRLIAAMSRCTGSGVARTVTSKRGTARSRASAAEDAPENIARARQEGFLVLIGTPGAAVAAALRQRICQLLTTGSEQVDASGGTVYVAGLEEDPVIAAALADPAIIGPLRYLLGSEPRLAGARYRSPKPGGGAQALHRDQAWPHSDGRWAAATVIIGLARFLRSNGATRIVPGTHADRVPFTARSVRYRHPGEVLLTGPAGSAYIFTGACLHSGTANTSPAERPGIQATFSR
jgi:hypothetical protein